MGCITSDWTDSEAGPKKKVYSLTSKGREVLSEFKDEVEHSLNNLQIFIKQYDGLEEN